MASNLQQFNQLNQEKIILEIIKYRDIHCESPQYIVHWIYPSQILSHNNNNNNNNGNESIYLLNEVGDLIPSPSPLSGLVFEFGEVNLNQYFIKNSKIPIIEKIHILEHIVNGVSFLHKLNIVHFDLKPDNIVRFNTTTHGTRWKIIDFDSCFDLNTTPKPSLIYPINQNNNINNIRLTEEYCPPEVMKVIKNISTNTSTSNQNNNNNNNNNNNSIEINYSMDIWSLGLISVFLLKGSNLWKLLYPQRDFDVSMLFEFNDDLLQRFLNVFEIGDKEKSFIEDCLKLDSKSRLSCEKLLLKTLFKTGPSTKNITQSNEMKEIKDSIDNVRSEMNEGRK